MSLVDYASSSDDDECKERIVVIPQRVEIPLLASAPPSDGTAFNSNRSRNSLPSKQGIVSNETETSKLKLPDASLLLNSPVVPMNVLNSSDHPSHVAAAMAQSTPRKRESNILPASNPRSKVPKGFLPNSKNVPDTLGGRLLPPQLVGRSNVVTEDIGKLFVKRPSNS